MIELRERIIASLKPLDTLKYDKSKRETHNGIESREYVVEALGFHCPGGSYSDLIMEQLVELHRGGSVKIGADYYPYVLRNLFCEMELVLKGEKIHKLFQSKKSELYGRSIYHVHHSPNHEIITNLIRYMRKHYKSDDIIVDQLSKLKTEHPHRDDYMTMFVHKALMNSYEWTEKTGEWLVFQKEGKNIHFVCLYLHNYDDTHDQEFYSFIENELKWNCT